MERESINAIFDNVSRSLPVYIPAMQSIVIGLTVSIVVLLISFRIAYLDMKHRRNETDPMLHSRWIGICLGGIVAGVMLGDFVRDKHYTFQSIYKNKQHFANVHWLKLYAGATRV